MIASCLFGGRSFKRELEYRIPRLHFPVNSQRLLESWGNFCNKTSFLYLLVENRFLPFAPVDFRRKPEPVPRTQVLSCHRNSRKRASKSVSDFKWTKFSVIGLECKGESRPQRQGSQETSIGASRRSVATNHTASTHNLSICMIPS